MSNNMSLLEILTRDHKILSMKDVVAPRAKTKKIDMHNVHEATIKLLNTILMKKGCPDNVKTDTLRVLSLMLEADPKDNFNESNFVAYLKKKDKKSRIKVAKATGGWVTKDMLKLNL